MTITDSSVPLITSYPASKDTSPTATMSFTQAELLHICDALYQYMNTSDKPNEECALPKDKGTALYGRFATEWDRLKFARAFPASKD